MNTFFTTFPILSSPFPNLSRLKIVFVEKKKTLSAPGGGGAGGGAGSGRNLENTCTYICTYVRMSVCTYVYICVMCVSIHIYVGGGGGGWARITTPVPPCTNL